MFTHEFNVYETLSKLDALLESGHEEPSPMDRAEYQLMTNKLVQGTLELLRHLAMHRVLVLESAESLHPITHRHIDSVATETDGAFSDEVVAINLPSELVPYGSIIDSMKQWNVGTIETVADLALTARLHQRFLAADEGSATESVAFEEWSRNCERLEERVLPSMELLEAAGMLRVTDLRTQTTYPCLVQRRDAVGIHIVIESEPPPAPATSSGRRKKKTITKSQRR